MKKSILAVAILALASTGVFAQGKKLEAAPKATSVVPAVAPTTTATPETTIKFKTETHDFGTLQEGDPAEAEFVFTNTGKKPLIIQNVQPGCGCTTPFWSKDPVAPGKTGVIKASYGTKGRVGAFNKNITVTSTAGTNVIYIKGTVEKAPESSAPQNNSMMKTN
ncbi:DUF1573 domain-containing protein [Taibaiella lutea]|uniref:DUF1573 domain-containing protein n=1 Tax=Taibaiella lutea TaxID=2608001 RepID=A0A5M6CIF7_9BACT|nr:DUF1573 domain-containing protein [Taibaiella lutea]KAA5534981.1 DUF1573 domain-containing protein [Taibaiella lutea]